MKKSNKHKESPAAYLFSFLNTIGHRGITLYLAIFLSAALLIDYDKIKTGSEIRTLHYLNPQAYDDLLDFIDGKGNVNQRQLKKYLYYYEQTTRYVPDSFESYGMLGFLYYHFGQKQKAVVSYEKATPSAWMPARLFCYSFYGSGAAALFSRSVSSRSHGPFRPPLTRRACPLPRGVRKFDAWWTRARRTSGPPGTWVCRPESSCCSS